MTGRWLVEQPRRTRFAARIAALALGAIAITSCGDEFAAPDAISATLEVAGVWADTIGDAQLSSLTIRVSGENGTRYEGLPLRWSLSDSTVLTLSRPVTPASASPAERAQDAQRILVVPRRAGGTTIVVALNAAGFRPTELRLPVVVRGDWPSLLTVTRSDTLALGTAAVDPALLGTVRYSWASTDPSVARVAALEGDSARAEIEARASGLVQVSVTASGERIGQLQWTRTVATRSVQLVPANDWPSYLPVNNTAALMLRVLDMNGDSIPSADVDWASTNEAAFIVVPSDSGAMLTASGRGAGEIIASVGRPPTEVRQYRWRFLVGERWRAVSAGGSHTCAVSANEHIGWCWGANDVGQVGLGVELADKARPSRVATNYRFSQIVAGRNHSCGREGDETVFCWGSRVVGQLGDGAPAYEHVFQTRYFRASPAVVMSGVQTRRAERLVAGGEHTCMAGTVDLTPLVHCWGRQSLSLSDSIRFGQLPTDATLYGGAYAQYASAGGAHICLDVVFAFGGRTRGTNCAGINDAGQLGDGTRISRTSFSKVRDVTRDSVVAKFFRSASGDRHSCAIDGSNGLWCWGSNSHGQLGAATTESCSGTPCSTVAIPVSIPVAFDSVTLGDRHSCVRSTVGDAWCWGSNTHGQLGRGTEGGNSPTPAQVVSPHKFVSLSAGGNHTCGVTTLGAVMCWGANGRGQLGDLTQVNRSVPMRIQEPE